MESEVKIPKKGAGARMRKKLRKFKRNIRPQILPTHAVLHFSVNWCMDGLAVEYFDSLAAALDYAQSFEITKSHERDSLVITEIKATAKACADGRFQLRYLPTVRGHIGKERHTK